MNRIPQEGTLIEDTLETQTTGPLKDCSNCYHFAIGGGYTTCKNCEGCNLWATGPDEAKPPGAKKFDTDKDPWHLAPWDAFRAIVKVLKFGASKYSARNWEQGMAWSRVYGALLRHLTAWWEGEGQDPETGMSHLWHVGCCAAFLIAYEIRGVGEDDRPVSGAKE